jgi:hypothetical protein
MLSRRKIGGLSVRIRVFRSIAACTTSRLALARKGLKCAVQRRSPPAGE